MTINLRRFDIIVRNAAKCALCNDVIESKHQHDFVSCTCGEIFVDGGKLYARYGFGKPENFISMYETRKLTETEARDKISKLNEEILENKYSDYFIEWRKKEIVEYELYLNYLENQK